MKNFTNHIYGTLLYKRRARFNDFRKFKPHLMKTVILIGGKETQVWKKRNHHAFWLYRCQSCDATGLTRSDRMDIFQCKCQKNVKRPRKYKEQSDEKTCPDCGKTYPLTQIHWYKQVRKGRTYFSTYCKKCRRRRDREYYDRTHITSRERSGSILYSRCDCGRAE